MKAIIRWLLLGALCLGPQVMSAQTVVRIAPPPPVQVGVIGRPPVQALFGPTDITAGTAEDMSGFQAAGFYHHESERYGCNRDGCTTEIPGCSTKVTGDDELIH